MLCSVFAAPPPWQAAMRTRVVMAAKAADDLFDTYAAAAPAVSGELFARCWSIVGEAISTTVPDANDVADAFDGALEAFVTDGPDDPTLIPEEQRALIEALSDTAASYTRFVDPERLSWGTCYRTLNRPTGAYFAGISLWPRTDVDVPKCTCCGVKLSVHTHTIRLTVCRTLSNHTSTGFLLSRTWRTARARAPLTDGFRT